jgi:hypothetical protein
MWVRNADEVGRQFNLAICLDLAVIRLGHVGADSQNVLNHFATDIVLLNS